MRLTVTTLIAAVALAVVSYATAKPATHNHRYQVVEHVKAGLAYYDHARHIPMRDAYWALEAAGHRFNVNPALMAGIAAKESELGRTACGRNPFGLGSCGSAWTPPDFRTWRQAIFYEARHLRRRFLDYGASSVQAILDGGYCVGCPTWASDVRAFMRPFRLGDGVTYPAARRLEVRRRAPTITSAVALGDGKVQVTWTGSTGLGSPGAVVRVKRDCQLTCGVGAIYTVPDTGSTTLTGQPAGTHYYRVCDQFCSPPVQVDVT